MQKLSSDIIYFLEKQGFVIVSTVDDSGSIHCAAKGIVGIEKSGKIYFIDLYHGQTYKNLLKNTNVSLTAIDEHLFTGYTLKGKAFIVDRSHIKKHIIKAWEDRVIKRISNRLIKNLKGERKGAAHPEARFPTPKYLIEAVIDKIVDLTPTHLKNNI